MSTLTNDFTTRVAATFGRRIPRCRYMGTFGQCTAEVADMQGEIALCVHHLALAWELIQRRAS